MPTERHRAADWLRVLMSVVLVVIFGVAAWKLGVFDPEEAEELRQQTGHRFLIPTFIAFYAGVTALALPGSPLAYGAGAVFGFTRAAVIVWTASLIGAAAGYVLARGVLSGPAKRLTGRHTERLSGLDNEKKVLVTALRLQLLPFIPFGVVNYAAGISKVPILPFLLATGIGVIPGTLVETFVGDQLTAGVRGGDRRALVLGLTIPLAIFSLSYVPKLVKKLRS